MMMEAFHVMFSGKSVYVSRRLVAIEPMTALNVLLVCELTQRRMKRFKFYQLYYIMVLGHEMLALVMVVICTGQ